jgi:hypothetical protein
MSENRREMTRDGYLIRLLGFLRHLSLKAKPLLHQRYGVLRHVP